MKPLKVIGGVQWYYEPQVDECPPILFHEVIHSTMGDLTEATGQAVPSSSNDYRYTHGGSKYREAVKAFWEKFPDYQTD